MDKTFFRKNSTFFFFCGFDMSFYHIDIFNFYEELKKAMRGSLWFDKSDIMTDYHHTAYFMDINIGQWNKPYKLLA